VRIIAVAGQKGGVGKSSTTLALATLGAEAGDRTLVVDVDPQGSASGWTEMLEAAEIPVPFDTVADTDPQILSRMRDGLADQFDTIWVDTPGSLEGRGVLEAVIRQADYVIAPTRPSVFDLQATVRTVRELIEPSGRPYRALLNMVDSRSPKEAEDARAFLDAQQIATFRTTVRLLKAHSDGLRDLRLITEARDAAQRKALDDFRGVTMELLAEWARAGQRASGGGSVVDVRDASSAAAAAGSAAVKAVRF
jgi:chromosome partitioning protein